MKLSDLSPEDRQALIKEIKAEICKDMDSVALQEAAAKRLRMAKDNMVDAAASKFALEICNNDRGHKNYSYIHNKVASAVKSLVNLSFKISVYTVNHDWLSRSGGKQMNVETDEDLKAYMDMVNTVLDAFRTMYNAGLISYEDRNSDG